MIDHGRLRPNNIYITFTEADNRTNWVVDADAVKVFMHTYDYAECSRFIRFVEPLISYRFYEKDCIFIIYDEEDRGYVQLTFNDVIRLLSQKDRDVTLFSKTIANRPVNVFKIIDDVLKSKPSEA
jgi:hypothetical protein